MTENEVAASEISQRIAQLESLSQENLKGEMQELKKALKENPQACLLLREEDIGAMVAALRKVTGTATIEASAKKTRTPKEKASTKKMSAEELQAALDDEDF